MIRAPKPCSADRARQCSIKPNFSATKNRNRKLNDRCPKNAHNSQKNPDETGPPVSALQGTPAAPPPLTSPLSESAQRLATLCGCIVAFAYSANYTNHAPLASALMRQFGFNNALAGLLTTGIFLTHAGMQIPGGYLVDRFGSRRMLLIALLWVAAGNFMMAAAGAYWQLLFCKIFTGMGTGVCFVGGARYVHEGCRGPRLIVAQGLFGGSIQLGAGFVIFAVPLLYKLAGWRATFLISCGYGTGRSGHLDSEGAARRVSSLAARKDPRHAPRAATLASGPFSDGYVRHVRGCGFVGGRSAGKGHEGSGHARRGRSVRWCCFSASCPARLEERCAVTLAFAHCLPAA